MTLKYFQRCKLIHFFHFKIQFFSNRRIMSCRHRVITKVTDASKEISLQVKNSMSHFLELRTPLGAIETKKIPETKLLTEMWVTDNVYN